MKYAKPILALFCLAAITLSLPMYAAEDITPPSATTGATLDIVGPESVKPGEDAWLRISGLTLDEIKRAKADNNFDLTVFPLIGVRVHATYDWLQDNLELSFKATNPGEYLVKIHLDRAGKLERAACVVAVEGDQAPFPEPDPKPDPAPPGSRLVLIYSESTTPSPAEGAVQEALRRRLQAMSQPPAFRILDPDTATEGNWGEPYKAKAEEVGLPALMVAVLPSGSNRLDAPYFVFAKPLPMDSAEAVSLVEEALK